MNIIVNSHVSALPRSAPPIERPAIAAAAAFATTSSLISIFAIATFAQPASAI